MQLSIRTALVVSGQTMVYEGIYVGVQMIEEDNTP